MDTVIFIHIVLRVLIAFSRCELASLTQSVFTSNKSDLKRPKRTTELGSLENKAVYMATEVACGWAGAIFEVTRLFGRSSEVKEIK